MKTLEEVKQEIALKYGMSDWMDLIGQFDNNDELYSELAEVFGKNSYEKGFQDGCETAAGDIFSRI